MRVNRQLSKLRLACCDWLVCSRGDLIFETAGNLLKQRKHFEQAMESINKKKGEWYNAGEKKV